MQDALMVDKYGDKHTAGNMAVVGEWTRPTTKVSCQRPNVPIVESIARGPLKNTDQGSFFGIKVIIEHCYVLSIQNKTSVQWQGLVEHCGLTHTCTPTDNV